MRRAQKTTACANDQDGATAKAKRGDSSLSTVSNPTSDSASCSTGRLEDVEDKICFIDSLPDNLVVRIFQGLKEPKDIAFVLPQVCKRWQRLASHENLWKDIHLSYDTYMPQLEKKLFFKCLKMAPKLSGLTFEVHRDVHDFASRIIKKCPNEVSTLHFIYDNYPPDVLFSLLSKYKHCLEKLEINDTYTPYEDEGAKILWKSILNLTKLKHLVVDGAALFYYKATFRKTAPCWQTFKILDVKDCSYENMNTVEKLISVHTNWIEVYLSTTTSSIFRGEVKALAKCTSLEAVQVPFCKEFKLLVNCEKLDSIIVDCVEETSDEISNVLPFLSKTNVFPVLKKVKIIGGESEYSPFLVALVKGRPISFLSFESCEITSEEMQDVLKNTPSLKTLYFSEMSAECISAVLLGLSNNELPELEEISMYECHCDEESKSCIHILVSELKLHSKIKVASDVEQCSCTL